MDVLQCSSEVLEVVEQRGQMGNEELCSFVTPGKGAVMKVPLPPLCLWSSHCWVRPATPGTLYVLNTSLMTLKKNQKVLKIPRPNSSLWAAVAQRTGKRSCSWTLCPFARTYVWFVQMLPRKACSTSLGSCACTVSLRNVSVILLI